MQIIFQNADLEAGRYLGEGEHLCSVFKMEQKQSKAGNPMIEIEFRDAVGRSTRDWFPTSGKVFKLASLALACGFPKELLLSGGFDSANLQGRKVKVVRAIKGKDDQGRNNYENSYHPATEGAVPEEHSSDIPF